MRVKSCAASDGAGHVIKLSDDIGCVLRPKMISRFLKARAPDERASVITYAFFHAFKFPDALSVHIKCKVEICRHGCLDHCQISGTPKDHSNSIGGNSHEGLLDRKDTLVGPVEPNENEKHNNDLVNDSGDVEDHSGPLDHDIFYDDIIHNANDLGYKANIKKKNIPPSNLPPPMQHQHSDMDDIESLFMHNQPMPEMLKKQQNVPPQQMNMNRPPPQPQSQMPLMPQQMTQQMQSKMDDEKFPHGPRQLQYAQNRAGLPVAGPRSLNLDDVDEQPTSRKRIKRSIHITDRKVRSADVGVSGIYDVISEADLAFSPDTKQEAVTIFQGQIKEEVVYGICMPVPGFSILFILVISATIIAALVAGSLLYRYQLQKDALAHQQATSPMNTANSLASWMTLRLFKMRHPHHLHHTEPPASELSEDSTSASSNRHAETRQ